MTENRMSWVDDEHLYQPRIHSQRIRELHQLAEQYDLPMTVLVDIILRRYVSESPILLPHPERDATQENRA